MKCPAIAVVVLLTLSACADETPSTSDTTVPSWAKVAPEQIAEAKKHGVAVAFENYLGVRFVLIPAGTFLMGPPPEDHDFRYTRGSPQSKMESPQHKVVIASPFYIQITEVTNAQYRAWKPKHSSGSWDEHPLDSDGRPAVLVSWNDATAFANWLSIEDASRAYRLATEAEWEYACRAGTTTPFHFGDTVTKDQANFDWDSDGSIESGEHQQATTPVGSFPPNAWGLYDMHGNVCEWCRDWFGPYPAGSVTDPVGPRVGTDHIVRGGYWLSSPPDLRAAYREVRRNATRSYVHDGFRLVCPLPESGK